MITDGCRGMEHSTFRNERKGAKSHHISVSSYLIISLPLQHASHKTSLATKVVGPELCTAALKSPIQASLLHVPIQHSSRLCSVKLLERSKYPRRQVHTMITSVERQMVVDRDCRVTTAPPSIAASIQIQAVDRTTLSIGEFVMASTGNTHGFPAGGGCWAGSSSQRADKDVACGDSLDKRRSSPPPVAPSTLILSTRIRKGGTFISILEAGFFADLAHTKSGTLQYIVSLMIRIRGRESTHSTSPKSRSRSPPFGGSSSTGFKSQILAYSEAATALRCKSSGLSDSIEYDGPSMTAYFVSPERSPPIPKSKSVSSVNQTRF